MPEAITVPGGAATTVEQLKDYASRLSLMMEEARRLGLHKTATALHERGGPVEVVGFEIADLILQNRGRG